VHYNGVGLGLWGFNATINNISAVLWHLVLLVKETGESKENHQPQQQVTIQTTSLPQVEDTTYSQTCV
jgi:hypothetical protein